jgi:23S rRNA (guanosine2251-2'-O)-methyltransferase
LENKQISSVLSLCQQRNIPVDYMPKAKLQILCGPVVHQGFVARIADFQYLVEEDFFKTLKNQSHPLLLILDQVQDTHNLGAIIRTAESVKLTALVIAEKGGAEINATVVKTSAGAVFHCPVLRTRDLIVCLNKLKSNGIRIIGTVSGKGNMIYRTDLSGSIAIVVGSEGKGVRKNILLSCDEQVSIPMQGKLDSLNVSVSTALVLYEALRQRYFNKER